jgi:hypothetical protein
MIAINRAAADSTKINTILSNCCELTEARYVIVDDIPVKILSFNMMLFLSEKIAGGNHCHIAPAT